MTPRLKQRPTGPEWIGGRLTVPVYVQDRGEPYQPEIILWLERGTDAIIGVMMPEKEGGPLSLAASLTETMERPKVGPPRRPHMVRIADPIQAAEVRAAFGDLLKVVVAPTPELDTVLAHLISEFPEGDSESQFDDDPPPDHITGRNDPCPCGSGKKYKKCHYESDRAARQSPPGPPVHTADNRLVARMAKYAMTRFGREWMRAADAFRDADRTVQLFLPWAVYHFPVNGRPVVDWFLSERGENLPREERSWLAAQREAWLSVWEVREVERGRGVVAVDLLTGETRRVAEVLGSEQLVPRDAVLGRVVDHAGISVFAGLHPRPLPPWEAGEVVRRLRTRLRLRGAVPVARLHREEVERYLIARWEDEVAAMDERHSKPPMLRNTDGDDLLFTTDHFAFDPGSRGEIESRLAALEGVEPPSPGDPDPEYVFIRQGGPQGDPEGNTLIGQVRFKEAGLRLETNSIERADRLRTRLEGLGEGLLRHRLREHSSPLAPRGPGSDAKLAPEPPPPEALQAVQEYLDFHYALWPDHPLPALDGATPRQAVRTRQGRERVDRLLKELEHRGVPGPGHLTPPVAKLRRELGLEEP